MGKETTLQKGWKEEVYTYWFKCGNCEQTEIQGNYSYCPMCGAKIKEGEVDRIIDFEDEIEKKAKIKAKKAEIREKEEELSKLEE
jgi:PHP family Zn ribbon phosphoesterase